MNAYIKIADWAIAVIQDMEELEQHECDLQDDLHDCMIEIETF